MRKFTLPAVVALLLFAGLAGAAHADPINCPGAWPACASRGATGDGTAPVGSLTHYLTALADDADGSVAHTS